MRSAWPERLKRLYAAVRSSSAMAESLPAQGEGKAGLGWVRVRGEGGLG